MVECWIPYGRTEVHITIPIQDLLGILEPELSRPLEDPSGGLERALREAMEGGAAEGLSGDATVAIALDGTLHPNLAALASSKAVERLREMGASPDRVTIIVGNGWRMHSNPQLMEALGAQPQLRGVKIYEHTPKTRELKPLGSTSKGTEAIINSHFASASVRMVIGETQPDGLVGFKGPQDVLLPGISSMKTLEMNRVHALGETPGPGRVEGNPILEDILEAAELADVDLAVNMVSNPDGKLLGVYAGEIGEVWKRALSDFGEAFKVRIEDTPDILVISAGGFKHDYDLYSAIWALTVARDMAEGVLSIILVAECPEGLGVEGLRARPAAGGIEELRRGYSLGAEAIPLLRSTLLRSRVHIVSALPRSYLEPLGLRPSRTANDALASASEGRRRKTLVLPRGCISIPSLP